jgi:hypothetical protein
MCGVALAGLLAVTAIGSAAATAALAPNNLFSGGGGSSVWTIGADAPGDRDGQAIELRLPASGGFAGVDFTGEASKPPATPPSFAFESSVTGPAQASPRLVITFSDGDYIDLRPDTAMAGVWSVLDGSTASWDDPGRGGCPALMAVTYQQTLACHTADGATVTGLDVIADGAFTGGATIDVDDISYGGTTITSPPITFGGNRLVVPSINVVCPSTSGGRCRVSAKLIAAVASRAGHGDVAVGTVKGRISPANGQDLTFTLNARGRALLADSGKLRVTVTGSVTGGGRRDRFKTRVTLTSL